MCARINWITFDSERKVRFIISVYLRSAPLKIYMLLRLGSMERANDRKTVNTAKSFAPLLGAPILSFYYCRPSYLIYASMKSRQFTIE